MDVIRFKPIEGNENYLVSNMGHVYSKKSDKILKNWVNLKGYFTVMLNKRKTLGVHRLVGLAFIPKVEGKNQIDHIDRNRQNNNLFNLRWVNSSENNRNRSDTRTDVPSDLTSKERRRLRRHIDFKKALEEKRYYCKHCDMAFGDSYNLNRHSKTKKHLSKIQQL